MRVIAGKNKGLKLSAPKGLKTRPTSDRIKENLFNLLQAEVRGARVLDLFSGSGGLGIEALSRGASFLLAVEKDKTSFKVLSKNVDKLKHKGPVCLKNKDAFVVLRRLSQPFDLVFIDPPYQGDLGFRAIRLLLEVGGLSRGGLLVYETARDKPGLDKSVYEAYGLTLRKQAFYGASCLSIYHYPDS